MKLLLADDNAERAQALAAALSADFAAEVVLLPPGARLVDEVQRVAPDVVIVDMDRPDRDGLDSIREVADVAPAPVVMFVDGDDGEFMRQAIDAGVSSYNVLGCSLPEVKPIVQAAVAIFERHQRMAERLARAEGELRERETIRLAKARLMTEKGWTEPEAHRYLRQSAMNGGKRLADVAAEIMRDGG